MEQRPFDVTAWVARLGAFKEPLPELPDGQPIGSLDALIAAQARRRAETIVTRNRREFERAPVLLVADWRT